MRSAYRPHNSSGTRHRVGKDLGFSILSDICITSKGNANIVGSTTLTFEIGSKDNYRMKSLLFSLLVASGLSSLAGNAYAQSTVYTNQSSFLEQVQSGYYLEDFNKRTPGTVQQGPVLFSGVISVMRSAPTSPQEFSSPPTTMLRLAQFGLPTHS